MSYGGHFDCDSKLIEIKKLEEETKKSDFWSNQEKAEEMIQEMNSLKEIVEPISKLKNQITSNLEILELLKMEPDEELEVSIEQDIVSIEEDLEKLRLNLLLSGKYDSENCILEIHPGAGGTESCDWAMILYRMYRKWVERKEYKVEVLDYQDGEEAGIKSVSMLIKGQNAYGYLKNEKGVHRLVRLSPFDANNRRHTSFASVEVTPDIKKDIDIKIDEKDLKIDVYRSTGAGGQGVNTTDSAVRITHLPTKIVVTCQNERSQIQNKEHAMQVLKTKLLILEEEKQQQELNNIKGNQQNIEFGSQIRSYILHPYSLIKDHRTSTETSNVTKVLDGDIDLFIESNLKRGA